MKYLSRLLVLSALVQLGFSSVHAQKVCYINLEKILNTVEDYKNAQQQIDNIAQKWQQEIDQEREKIESLYNRYQAEQVLWSEETRKKKEEEIVELEENVREMYELRFGPDGALFKKRQELIRPIQEKVYAVIETYAVERGYDFIYDVNTAAGLLYTNNRYDKTDDIIRRVRY